MRRYEEDREDGPLGICDDCGEECRATWMDVGIGPYEFWGSKGVHEEWIQASPCCSAPVVEGANTLVRIGNHIAKKDHKDGKVKKGQSYRLVVTRCWRRNGPSWIRTRKIIQTPKNIFEGVVSLS